MKIGIIDIGSNSIRLTVYETRFDEFRILFKEKIMAGLASYVEKGALTEEGIDAACSAILEFRGILDALKITHFKVFATASLRNIKNTEEALAQILEETDSAVEVLSGEEEAYLGYFGVMEELDLKNGVIVDIGVHARGRRAGTRIRRFLEESLRQMLRAVSEILTTQAKSLSFITHLPFIL